MCVALVTPAVHGDTVKFSIRAEKKVFELTEQKKYKTFHGIFDEPKGRVLKLQPRFQSCIVVQAPLWY